MSVGPNGHRVLKCKCGSRPTRRCRVPPFPRKPSDEDRRREDFRYARNESYESGGEPERYLTSSWQSLLILNAMPIELTNSC